MVCVASPGGQSRCQDALSDKRLLDACLLSPCRLSGRPASPPRKRGNSKTASRPTSVHCGICGRPAATRAELPAEWIKLYQTSSNPKCGWSPKPDRAARPHVHSWQGLSPKPKSQASPWSEVKRTSTRRSSPGLFQSAEEVEVQLNAWRAKVLRSCNPRQRQTSLVEFVDQVMSACKSEAEGGLVETLKLETGGDPGTSGPRHEVPPEVLSREKSDEGPNKLDLSMSFISTADRFRLNQIFGQLSVNGDLFVDRVAEGIEMLEGKACDKEWVREILREHLPGRMYLDRADFISFVDMYRRHRHAFMLNIFNEVDADGSKSVSLEELVQLLGRRGITPVLSCVERIFREVTGEKEVRDLSFDEFVEIYDVVQARAGFSEHDLNRLRKVWSRYDTDGNQVLSADEVRLALYWQGFAVDNAEVEELALEVGRKKGLNQHEFLVFMKKYRDNEVQKLIQLNTSTTGNEAVRLEDIPRLLRTLGYEEVPPEVVQECAALVHLVNLDLAAGIRPLCSTFTFDGLYHFMENLRASHGFINAERVDLKNAFLRFSTEKFSKSGFIEDDSSTAEDEEAQISVLKLFHALRWLGYQVELWQVLEKMDGIGMVGSASLCQEEFMRVMAGLHRQELECIQEMLQESPEIQRVNSEASAGIAPADQEVQAGPVTAKRLKVLFQQLGYSMPGSELVGLSKEFAQGYFPQDVWGVAQVLRRHRNKVRDEVRKNFGFARAELRGLQEAFEQLARPAGTLQGKQLSLAVRQLFPGAEKERLERQRAHQTIKQVTKSRACEELDFQEFLHLVRLCLDREAEAKLNEEHQALERLPFVASEVTEFRIIFHGVALQEKSKASEQCTSILGNVSAIPCLSYIAVEAMLAGITGDVSELTREALQEILLAVDMEKKGSLYFWEFLEAVRALMDENWHSINDEAQKMVLESWAQKEADALYKSRVAESARLDET